MSFGKGREFYFQLPENDYLDASASHLIFMMSIITASKNVSHNDLPG